MGSGIEGRKGRGGKKQIQHVVGGEWDRGEEGERRGETDRNQVGGEWDRGEDGERREETAITPGGREVG